MLLVDPLGKYLFAKNASDGTMNAYIIGSDSQPTRNGSVSGTVASGKQTWGIAYVKK